MQPPPSPTRSNERPDWVILVVVLAAMGSCALVALPLGVYGFRSYVTRTKVAETREIMRALAAGIAECTASTHSGSNAPRLPPTALPVPLALASVSGRTYQSAMSDWQDEAYRCARFTHALPQSAQLQWIRASDTAGHVRATLDVNGDMTPDWILEQVVECSADGGCALGEPSERR
jgi:hypothetical protein